VKPSATGSHEPRWLQLYRAYCSANEILLTRRNRDKPWEHCQLAIMTDEQQSTTSIYVWSWWNQNDQMMIDLICWRCHVDGVCLTLYGHIKTAQQRTIAIRWLVHWPLMGGLLQWGGACAGWGVTHSTGRGGAPLSPLLAVLNVTAHPSTAGVPTSYVAL